MSMTPLLGGCAIAPAFIGGTGDRAAAAAASAAAAVAAEEHVRRSTLVIRNTKNVTTRAGHIK